MKSRKELHAQATQSTSAEHSPFSSASCLTSLSPHHNTTIYYSPHLKDEETEVWRTLRNFYGVSKIVNAEARNQMWECEPRTHAFAPGAQQVGRCPEGTQLCDTAAPLCIMGMHPLQTSCVREIARQTNKMSVSFNMPLKCQ